MKRFYLTLAILLMGTLLQPLSAQPNYDYSKLKMEKLGRGVIAVKTTDGKVAISWRQLRDDAKNLTFNVFRNDQQINLEPISKATFFVDEKPEYSDGLAKYKVSPIGEGIEGSYTLSQNAPEGYLPIPLQKPEGGRTPDGRKFTYSANDASVGDADGDGEMEIYLKWEPSNSRDNAHDGFTGNVLFDCYKLDGTRLWRIDLGHNIRAGAHYTQFLVYDFDNDGSAEIIMKTGDGTIDGLGKVIGDSTKDYRRGVAEAREYYAKNKDQIEEETKRMEEMMKNWKPQGPQIGPPQKPNKRDRNMFRNMNGRFGRGSGRILEGPEYLTIFSGRTGEALATVDYVPQRGKSEDWGDDNGNRCDRYLACVAYLDGERPSAVMCRGYYTRAVLAAFNWDGKELKQYWVFDSDKKGNKKYAGQGNHNLRVGDVDGDGCDEIVYGSCCIDNDGTGLYTTGMGHGDAMHMMCFDPKSNELQVWDCHENRRDGASFRSAKTGEVLFQSKAKWDVGRCMAADIDPTNEGVEMWSVACDGIFNIKGENIASSRGLSVNFAVWWDGDLLRELLDRSQVTKYDWENGGVKVLKRFEGTTFNNSTKQNPCISGDIIGDWREEVLTRTMDSNELRLYTTDIPTNYRMNTLLQDVPYRMSIAAENVTYNQPPEVGFYLGEKK